MKFKSNIAEAIKKIQAEASLLQEAVAVETWREAKRLVPAPPMSPWNTKYEGEHPYATGKLFRSIGIKKVSKGFGWVKYEVIAGDEKVTGIHYSGQSVGAGEGGAGHALYVELGTRKMSAQPFLRPALLAQIGKIKGFKGKSLFVY